MTAMPIIRQMAMFSMIKMSYMYRIAGNFREVQIFAIFATHDRGVATNEAEEAVASSLFCARAHVRIGDIIYN